MKWFRLYDDVIDDPKVMQMPVERRWQWIGLLCIANRQDPRGSLPPASAIAFHMRCDERQAVDHLKFFDDAGFLDRDGSHYRIHGWDKRQFKSDDMTARTSRWKANNNVPRKQAGNVPGNVPGNGPEAETETETEAEGAPAAKIDPSEAKRVSDLAAKIGGDIGWSVWADNRFRMGDTPEIIEAALSAAVDAKVIKTSYVGKIAARYAKEGIPTISANGRPPAGPDHAPKFVTAPPNWKGPRPA